MSFNQNDYRCSSRVTPGTFNFGQTHYLTLIINMIVPVGVMWLIVSNIHLPKPKNQEQLLARATEIIFNYDTPANSWEKITTLNKSISSFKFSLFYFFYALLFLTRFLCYI